MFSFCQFCSTVFHFTPSFPPPLWSSLFLLPSILFDVFLSPHFLVQLLLLLAPAAIISLFFFFLIRGIFPFTFFKNYLFLFIYLFMAVPGLCFCTRAFSSCGKRGPLFIAMRGPLTITASLVAEHRLQTRRLSNCGSRA